MPSPHLVDALDQVDPIAYRAEAFRHVSAGRHPLSGAGARTVGGRWNPPGSFATLYLGDSKETVEKEFERMVARAGRSTADFLPRRLYRYELTLAAVIDLTVAGQPEALATVDFGADDLRFTQAIGEAAQYLGNEAILAPSATGIGTVIAVFNDQLRQGSSVQAGDWESWADSSRG
jgi:RES domain-containing protein